MISIHIQGHYPEGHAARAWRCSGVDLWLLDTAPHRDHQTHFHSRIWVAVWQVEQNHISRPWWISVTRVSGLTKKPTNAKPQAQTHTHNTYIQIQNAMTPAISLQNAMCPISMDMQITKLMPKQHDALWHPRGDLQVLICPCHQLGPLCQTRRAASILGCLFFSIHFCYAHFIVPEQGQHVCRVQEPTTLWQIPGLYRVN